MPRLLGLLSLLAASGVDADGCADGSCVDDDVTLLQVSRRNVVKEAPLVFPVICPPPFFQTFVSDFSLEVFTSAKWHVQKTTEEASHEGWTCHFMEYSALNASSPSGWEVRSFHNSSKQNGTDHLGLELYVGQTSERCLKVTDASQGLLSVGNCSDSPEAGAPLWVVAYDEALGYAMLSEGGAPTEVFDGGCRSAGFAILTRQQSRNTALVSSCSARLQDMGFDATALRDVQQTGCPNADPAITSTLGDGHVPSGGFGFEGHWHDDHGGIVEISRSGSKLTMEDNEIDDGTYECDLTNETHCELFMHGALMYGELQASGHHIHWHMSAGHEEWQRVGYEDEDDSFTHGPPLNPAAEAAESSSDGNDADTNPA